ncbi:MAG TPA: ABC transporter ATP-binding protein [Nitrospirae bacterium]|nr:cobalt import ATP-binding protein CbiO [bacterium BMS3Abin08]HDO35316.1 ABC transporter ATP-binding protein [Nitrospirota bacterium]
MIELQDLSFTYPYGKSVFNDLNFSLKRGKRIGLVGPNGAGKTTLFHLIVGLLKPDSGEVRILGKRRKDEEDFIEVRQRIGLLFQDSDDQLFSPTVEEDIAFGPLNLGKTHEQARLVVQKTCEILGLKGFEKKVTYRLSGGEKRLVALATVVAMDPECFLLDEPTAGLDEATRGRFLKYLKGHADTYIIISHDRELLKEATDKLYRLNDGKITPV